MDDPKDLDDIPEFLIEAAKAPRKPPEPPKSAAPAASPEKGATAMTTQTSPKPAPKAKAKAKTSRLPVPPPRLRTAISKPTKGTKPAAKAKAKPAKAAKPAKPAKAGGKRGSKLELIRALLIRPQGCTGADVLKATGWPSFSMNQQAEAMGLLSKLGKEKKPGSPTRYFVKK